MTEVLSDKQKDALELFKFKILNLVRVSKVVREDVNQHTSFWP